MIRGQVIGQARGEHVRTMAHSGELTSRWQDWPARRLAARKRELGTTVSVVVPARNEEATVGEVVSRIAKLAADTDRKSVV